MTIAFFLHQGQMFAGHLTFQKCVQVFKCPRGYFMTLVYRSPKRKAPPSVSRPDMPPPPELRRAARRLKHSFSAMAKNEYIERLRQVIFQMHKSTSIWVESARVEGIFRGRTSWKGDVEVFDLTDHPKAKRCYGWTFGKPEHLVTVLELPPVADAKSAVKIGVSCQVKKARNQK